MTLIDDVVKLGVPSQSGWPPTGNVPGARADHAAIIAHLSAGLDHLEQAQTLFARNLPARGRCAAPDDRAMRGFNDIRIMVDQLAMLVFAARKADMLAERAAAAAGGKGAGNKVTGGPRLRLACAPSGARPGAPAAPGAKPALRLVAPSA